MIVDLVKLQEALDYIQAINKADLKDIVWGNTPSNEIASEISVDKFKFMGLNNIEFADINGVINTHYMRGE